MFSPDAWGWSGHELPTLADDNVAEILLTILRKEDQSFGQAVEIARQIATDFWEISAT